VIRELSRELAAVGIRGRRRERILTEIADHLACDPAASLGEPRALAKQFADELATDSARRTAVGTFAALAITALALAVPQVSLPTVPDITAGRSILLAGPAAFAMVLGAQVAFAAGSLAAMRALRVRRARTLPDGEVTVLRRRTAVALAAGGAVVAGSVLYVVNFWALVPAWWAALALATGLAAVVPLGIAALAHFRASTLHVTERAPAAGLSADLGPAARPWLIGAAVVLVMFAGTSVAERSAVEGALRAGFEAAAFAGCFFAFRRPLALSG
jgi:hypothetical protein